MSDPMRWRQWAEMAAKHLSAESGWDFVPAAMLEVLDALASARSERDEARADHLRVRDECFATMEALADERRARDAARPEVEELKGALRTQNDLALERLNRAVAAEATAERLRGERSEAYAVLIPLTQAIDVLANVPAGDQDDRLVWDRVVAPAHAAAQDHLLARESAAYRGLAASTGKTRQPLPRRVAKHLTGEDLKDAMERVNPTPAPEDYEDEASDAPVKEPTPADPRVAHRCKKGEPCRCGPTRLRIVKET